MTAPRLPVPAWKVINPEPVGMLKHALRYAAFGWSVLPLNYLDGGKCSCGTAHCRSAGKHPFGKLVQNGVKDATKDKSIISDWFARYPKINIGIATGEASGLDVIDIDVRNDGDDTISKLEAKRGKLPDTLEVMTGGGGRHVYCLHATGKRLRSPGRGVDMQSSGKFVVAPPSVHASGRKYEWEGSSDPFFGKIAAPLPEHFTDGDKVAKPGNLTRITRIGALGFMSEKQIADARAALRHPGAWDVDNYDEWIKVGQALHSTDAVEAYEVWDTWSQTGKNYQPAVMKTHWDSFNANGGIHMDTIFRIAYNAGWDGVGSHVARVIHLDDEPRTEPEIEPVKAGGHASLLADDGPPSELLVVPGVLGDLVTEANRSAPKVQPQFAVLTALAFGSVVLARRYRTTEGNFTSGYYVAVGESGCGKEHIRSVITKSLSAAKLENLLGQGGYTSDSAIQSELIDKPAHIAVVDEFGDLMSISTVPINQNKANAISMLTQVWGLTDGELRPQARARLGLTKKQSEATKPKNIINPGLCLVGLTTPTSLYTGITEKAITGGFLNRINIVETNIGDTVRRRKVPEFVVPESILAWCAATRQSAAGNLAGIEHACDSVPPRVVIPIDDAALDAFETFDIFSMELKAALKAEGLAELYARTNEKALRIAAILAASVDPLHPVITLANARWAILYVTYYTAQTCASIRRNMTGGKFGGWCADAMRVIKHNGEKITTIRDLCKQSRILRALTSRELDSVTGTLASQGEIEFVKRESPSGRSKSRQGWIIARHDD